MPSYTMNLPDPIKPERYSHLLHAAWSSAAAVCGPDNIELLDDSGQPFSEHQKQWEEAGRRFPWQARSESVSATPREPAGDGGLPTARLTLDGTALLFFAARILDAVAPFNPASFGMLINNAASLAPSIVFQANTEVELSEQLRTVDAFSEALGVDKPDHGPKKATLTVVFQGVKVVVQTHQLEQATWRPAKETPAYQASEHAEELYTLAAGLRVLGSGQVHQISVWFASNSLGFLHRIVVTPQGIRTLEKLNGFPVEPDDRGCHDFTEVLPNRKMSVYRLV